jgi:hypothetical protein
MRRKLPTYIGSEIERKREETQVAAVRRLLSVPRLMLSEKLTRRRSCRAEILQYEIQISYMARADIRRNIIAFLCCFIWRIFNNDKKEP